MTPTEKIDAALDSVLKHTGIEIKDYNVLPSTVSGLRAAMRKIMSDEYKAGTNAAHEAMKGK